LYDGYDQNIALSIKGTRPNLDQVTRELLTRFGKSIGVARDRPDFQRPAKKGPRRRRSVEASKRRTAGGFRSSLFGDCGSSMPENPRRLTLVNWRELVAETIRRRKAERMTQREHAALASVSVPTIVAFDRGERTLSLAKAFDILRVVGLLEEPTHEGAQEAFVQEAFTRWRDLTAKLPQNICRNASWSPGDAQRPLAMNSINIIAPYKFLGMWVFDDPRVGLVQEPFVSGADTMIDRVVATIPDADKGFVLMFSSVPFPGHQFRLDWRRDDGSGNWYYASDLDLEGWLCPALLRYFPEAPKTIYIQVKSR
jgi:transcriptional regulator with XRE-family HTH domain